MLHYSVRKADVDLAPLIFYEIHQRNVPTNLPAVLEVESLWQDQHLSSKELLFEKNRKMG